jgi:hypothetical protein
MRDKPQNKGDEKMTQTTQTRPAMNNWTLISGNNMPYLTYTDGVNTVVLTIDSWRDVLAITVNGRALLEIENINTVVEAYEAYLTQFPRQRL